MDSLRVYFVQREQVVLDLLRQLVQIESPSTDKASTDRIALFTAEEAAQAGASITLVSGERWGDHVLARWGEGRGGFLVLCHLDTVWPLGTLRQRPWQVEGERASGPGCLDDKSGAAIILAVLKGLRELGLTPCRPLTILFNSDEEAGSPSSRALIELVARQAGVVLCMEPALPDGSLKVWRKGVGRYTVTAFGRAAHSGADLEQGINAIEELAHQVLQLQKMTDDSPGSTASVGRIEGGTRVNVVPDRAQAEVDLRVRTAAEAARLDAALKGLTPTLPGAHLVIEGGFNRPPMEESPVTLEPFARAKEIAADLGLPLTAAGTGGGSDGNFTAAMGVPTLDGLGAVGGGAHSPDEFVFIPSLAERTALVAALLTRW